MSARALALGLALASSLALPPRLARAQDHPEDPPGAEGAERTSRRAYDRRAPADRTAEEAVRWPVRVALAPLRLIVWAGRETTRAMLEPIHETSSSIEGDRDDDGGASPPEPPLSALPVLHLETERSPAVGARVRLVPARSVDVEIGGQHWDDVRIEAWLLARVALTDGAELRVEGDGSTRGDRIYHGLGWDAAADARARYRHHRGGGVVGVRLGDAGRGTRLVVEGRFMHHRFAGSGYGGEREPSVDAQPGTLPPGFAEGASVIEPRARLIVDSRERGGAATPGVALELGGGYGSDVAGDARWARAEAMSAATIALAGEHDLTLSGWASVVEPVGSERAPVPFVERLVLGGEPGRLSGFPLGRLHGDSAAIVHARYRWGIDPSADAALHVELGNVFGRALFDFHVERARLSVGLAIDGLGDDTHRLGFLFAVGTDALIEGATPSSGHVRLFVGAPPR